jgi:hypothetical protein
MNNTVTLRRIKKHQQLGAPAYKNAKVYFSVNLDKRTGERPRILDEEEVKYFSEQLGIDPKQLSVPSSEYWRDFVYIMQGEKEELSEDDPLHKLVLKVLERDERVANGQEDIKNKSRAEYLLVKESQVIKTELDRATYKIDAMAKFAQLSEEDHINILLVYGRNPKDMKADKIKLSVYQEIESNPAKFLNIVNDKNFDTKVLINDLVQEGKIKKQGSAFVFDGEMIAHDLESMVKYIKDPKNVNVVIGLKRALNSSRQSEKYSV